MLGAGIPWIILLPLALMGVMWGIRVGHKERLKEFKNK